MDDFEKYWEEFGELHASFCKGNIKQFAKEFWLSGASNTKYEEITNVKGTIEVNDLAISNIPKLLNPEEVTQKGHYLWLASWVINCKADPVNNWASVQCYPGARKELLIKNVDPGLMHPMDHGLYYGPIKPPKVDINRLRKISCESKTK